VNARDLAMAASGAVLAGSIIIARYELRGEPQSNPASIVSALQARDSTTRESVGTEAEPMAAAAPSVPASKSPPDLNLAGSAPHAPAQVERLRSKLAEVTREKRDLEAQLQAVEGELNRRANVPRTGDPQEFELDAEDWKALAAEGRIKYRIPCVLPPEATYGNMRGALDKLGLSPEEGDVLTEIHRRSNARVWSTLRPLCVELTGNAEVVDQLGASNCLSLIERASEKDGKASLASRRRVAEVHAGLAPAPSDASPAAARRDPLFTALLAVTSEAKRFQSDLAETFGPEEAKLINDSLPCVTTAR
jgi:hypothetical protein